MLSPPERLDSLLAQVMGISRSHASTVISSQGVDVNGVPAKKAFMVQPGDLVQLHPVEPSREPEQRPVIPIPVLYHDDDIIVVDKPPGVVVHPSPGWLGPSVVGSLQAKGFRLSPLGPHERPGVVHRLDSGTSGVMVLAASDRAYRELKRAFHDRQVHKVYRALVQGYPSPSSGTIDAPIGRHPSSSWKFAVVRDGKPSITHYDTVEVYPGASLLEIHLETGRTHQIRVHFQAEHHPLVGDLFYGADPVFAGRLGLERPWLHALSLSFRHPGSGDAVSFHSDPPDDLLTALSRLEQG